MSPRASHVPTTVVVLALLAAAALPPTVRAQVLNQPPSVEISHPGNESVVRGTVNVTGNASDVDGEVQRVEVRVDDGRWRNATGTSPWNLTWDTSLWSSGNHTLTARSWDGSDYSDNATVNVTVDQAPTVTVDAPVEGQTVAGEVDVTGTASDPENSLDGVRYHVDDGPWRNASGTRQWSFRWNTSNVTDGNHTLTVQADDGNATASQVVNVTVENRQNRAPNVTIERPPDGATVAREVEVAGTALDPDGSVEQVLVRVDDGLWHEANGTDDWSFTWQTTSWEDGSHTVVARADDGNATSTTSVNVTVDNGEGAQEAKPPTVEITDPEDGARVNGTVQIEGVASDPDSAVERVEVRVDDGPWQTADGTTEWRFAWGASSADEGRHTVQARALSAQRASSVDSVTLRVTGSQQTADQQPSVEILEPGNGTTVEGEVRVEGRVTGSAGVVQEVEVRAGNGSWRAAEGVDPWSTTVDASRLEPGTHRLSARAVTDEGPRAPTWIEVEVPSNERLEATGTNASTQEDGEAPTLTVQSPESGSTVESEVTFAGTAQDPDDSFVRAEIRVDDRPWQSVRVATGERFSTSVPVGDLERGEHTVVMRASDGEHLSDEQTATVTVEDSATVPGLGVGIVLTAVGAAALAGHRRW